MASFDHMFQSIIDEIFIHRNGLPFILLCSRIYYSIEGYIRYTTVDVLQKIPIIRLALCIFIIWQLFTMQIGEIQEIF